MNQLKNLVLLAACLAVSALAVEPEIPHQCASCLEGHLREPAPLAEPVDLGTVPADVQYYELIPGVIPTDGSQTFRLCVHLGRPVNRVSIPASFSSFTATRSELLDDGTGGDETAGDGVYTSGEISIASDFEENSPPLSYNFIEPTLSGIDFRSTGSITVEETDGSEDTFLIETHIGLIETNIPATRVKTLSADVQAASHVINVRGSGTAAAQDRLHNLRSSNALAELSQKVYAVLPDDYDFMVIFSAMHGEKIPRTSRANFNAGIHIKARNPNQGIGLFPFDNTASYGSAGRLQSFNLIDTAERGAYINNVIHEITHQWSAFLDASTGLKADGAHWGVNSSIGGVLGGYRWIPQPDGTWLLDPDATRSRLSVMPEFDRYLAGFIPASEVTPLMAFDEGDKRAFLRARDGDPVLPSEVTFTNTIDDIIAEEGPRLPAAFEAQRHFNTLFVVESVDRLFGPEEMTFYNRLCREFERLLDPTEPDPILTFNWVPATRYLGPGITIGSRVTGWDDDQDGLYDDWERTYFGDLSQDAGGDPDGDGANNLLEQASHMHPAHADVQRSPRSYRKGEDCVVELTRYLPGFNYQLEMSPNLKAPTTWSPVTGAPNLSGPHDRFQFSFEDVANGTRLPRRFFRVRVGPIEAQ